MRSIEVVVFDFSNIERREVYASYKIDDAKSLVFEFLVLLMRKLRSLVCFNK